MKKIALLWFVILISHVTTINGQDASERISDDSSTPYLVALKKIHQAKTIINLETYLPPRDPFPTFADFYQAENRLGQSLEFFNNVIHQYIPNHYLKEIEKQHLKDHFSEWRKEQSEVVLAWRQALSSMIIPQFTSPPYKKYIYPSNNKYPPNIDSYKIVEPDVRKSYEEALWIKKTSIMKSTAQKRLAITFRIHEQNIIPFLAALYKYHSRDDEELVQLLERYHYPLDERIKLLDKLGISYKSFRKWESTDGLFKTTAKFIALEKDDVVLEKHDGKRTAIELKSLRKEDQDYVKTLITSETKKTNEDQTTPK